MAGDESNHSYTFSLEQLRRKSTKKIRIMRGIRSIEGSRIFEHCIKRAIEIDAREGEQPTTVGDNEQPTTVGDNEQPTTVGDNEQGSTLDDDDWRRYKRFWRCIRESGGDFPLPLPPWRWENDDDDDDKKDRWLLLLTDDLVDEGWDWERIRLLLIKLIRRYQDVLVHVKFEGTMTSMIELGLITPGGRRLRRWNRPKKSFKHFVEDINARDPRIVFELKIHPSLDKNGNNVSPRHSEVYLYGLP